jgi:SLT domain-containing protein
MQAIGLTGVGANWAGPLRTLIMRESGGNPRSINLTDSNARAGYPSQGLMQTIPQTFAHYRLSSLPNDITNPIANIVAGIRYILARYGTIFNVQQANANLPPRGYSAGGLVFDQGGSLAPGWNTIYNGLGRREHLVPAGAGPMFAPGAFQLIVQGDVTDGTLPRVQRMLDEAMHKISHEISKGQRR